MKLWFWALFLVLPNLAHSLIPESCRARKQNITDAENAMVYSEWGHLNANHNGEFYQVRIVKNASTSGYSLWFCDSYDCAPLFSQLFFPEATDDRLKSCKLMERLQQKGIKIPSNYKWKMIWGPYPLEFDVGNISPTQLCLGAKQAFSDCLGGLPQ